MAADHNSAALLPFPAGNNAALMAPMITGVAIDLTGGDWDCMLGNFAGGAAGGALGCIGRSIEVALATGGFITFLPYQIPGGGSTQIPLKLYFPPGVTKLYLVRKVFKTGTDAGLQAPSAIVIGA
jgi:hypothetical protein